MKTFFRCWVLFGVLGLAAEALAQRPAPPPASQTEVNAGTDTYKYVTPAGLAGYSLLQSTSSISALTATNIAEYAAQTRDLAMSNILSTRLDGTNTALRAAWALADNVVSNALSARLIATNANLQPLDSDLTALAGLGDPGADRLIFWDDSASSMAYLTLGTGLTISGTTITASGGTGGTGMQNPATADFDVANYSLLNVDTIYGNDAAHGSDLSLHSYDSDASIKLYTFDSGSGIQYASQNGHTFTGPVTFNDGVTSAAWSFTSVAATEVYPGLTNVAVMGTDANGKMVAGSGGGSGTGSSNLTDNAYSANVRSNFNVGGLSTFSNTVSIVGTTSGSSFLGVGITNGASTNLMEIGLSGSKFFEVGTNGSTRISGTASVGTIIATSVSGNGSGLTNINAANLAGTLASGAVTNSSGSRVAYLSDTGGSSQTHSMWFGSWPNVAVTTTARYYSIGYLGNGTTPAGAAFPVPMNCILTNFVFGSYVSGAISGTNIQFVVYTNLSPSHITNSFYPAGSGAATFSRTNAGISLTNMSSICIQAVGSASFTSTLTWSCEVIPQ